MAERAARALRPLLSATCSVLRLRLTAAQLGATPPRSWCIRVANHHCPHPLGESDAEYVEVAIVSVLTVAVDTFARAIGTPPWALPEPVDGEPVRLRPDNLTDEGAYVPTIPSGGAGPAEADLYNPFGANIYRSISLVPDQARLFYAILRAQYLQSKDVADPQSNGGRAISRPQIELIAARVSALNGCFF